MKQYPKLVLNRNYTLATLYGHRIRFTAGEPISVPPIVYQDALAIGAQPVDGEAVDVLGEGDKDHAPVDPGARRAQITAAIELLVEENARKDFTAAGTPAAKAVEREVGFSVDAREVAEAWKAYHEAKAEE